MQCCDRGKRDEEKVEIGKRKGVQDDGVGVEREGGGHDGVAAWANPRVERQRSVHVMQRGVPSFPTPAT